MIKTTNTPFLKGMFRKSGIYLNYDRHVSEPHQFVARFKHRGPVTIAQFQKELIANHSVEDYFHQLHVEKKAPLAILKEKNPTWYQNLKSVWMAKNS